MSVSKDLSSKISSDRIKLQDQIIGQFEEDLQLKIFCERHENQLVNEICCNPNCDKKDILLCGKCIQKGLRHGEGCAKYTLALEIGIQQIANRFLAVCPENTQEMYREYFDQIAFSENQNVQEFERFLQMQKEKVEKNIKSISQTFQQYMEGIKTDIDKKMDEQLKIYKSNYAQFKTQLDSTIGKEYKILRECSEYKNILKRLNNSSDEEANKFIFEICRLLKKYTGGDTETEITINSIQDLFLLLTDQTTNPPTYQSHNFEVFSLSSIKLQVNIFFLKDRFFKQIYKRQKQIHFILISKQNEQLLQNISEYFLLENQYFVIENLMNAEYINKQVELLSNKIVESMEQNLLNTPIQKYMLEDDKTNLLNVPNPMSNEPNVNNRISKMTSSRITTHPNDTVFSYFDDGDVSSDTIIQEKLLKKSFSTQRVTSSLKNLDEMGADFGANQIKDILQSPKKTKRFILNSSFSENKSQISFCHEKKNCLIKQNQKNFFLERSQSTRSLQVNENVCVTSLAVLAENIVAIGLTNNYIHIYHMETNNLLQEIECKNWIYSLSTLRVQSDQSFLKSVGEQIIENPERKMSEYGFKLLGGSENSVKIWDTNFVKGQKIYPQMEFRREGFFRGMSLLDLEDNFNLVCGDWDGRIYIWDYAADNMLFKLDTEGQIVHRLQLLKGQDMFISAHRIDYNQGGILIWKLDYEQQENSIENRESKEYFECNSSQQFESKFKDNNGKESGTKENEGVNKNKLIRCTQLKRLEGASSVNCFLSLKTNPDYIVTSERNHIKLWDIRENKLIKTLYKGESKAKDILLIENSSEGSNYFITLFANNSVMKMIDSNEFLVGQYQLEDYPCDQCRKYFHSSKMSFLEAQDGQLYVIVTRHKHICSHFSEYMSQQQFSQIEKLSSIQLQQHIKSQNEHNKEFQKCNLFTRLSLQGLRLQIAKNSQRPQ